MMKPFLHCCLLAMTLAASPLYAEPKTSNQAPAATSSGARTASMDALRALHEAMLQAMQDTRELRMSGDADHDFVTLMIHHHHQAVAMAQVQLEHSTDSGVRDTAQSIIAASKKQIAQLQRWQAQHAQQS